MRDLLLGLDLTRKQRGLEMALRDAIRAGQLTPGQALPSTRGLATDLGIARATVVAAYDQLASEGYLITRQGTLACVAEGTWTPDEPANGPDRPAYRLDLIPGEPDTSQFPRAGWLRCTREVLATAPDTLFGYGDPSVQVEFRTELASYLSRTRNVAASPDGIVVVPGAASGLGQLARMLRHRGITAIAVEEPGFPFHQAILRREGLRLLPVPVDAEGIDVDALASSPVRAVVVTPAHQYPLGVVMSAERRADLTDWARRRNAWIIEDDYDGEFRYDRRSIGALQGLAPDRVVYLGTTSKTLGAGLRIAWLALPPELRAPLADQRGRDSDVSQLAQAVLSHAIARGDLDRHVRRMRAHYSARRNQLVETLHAAMDIPDIRGVPAGLHVTIALPSSLDEHSVAQRALNEHRLALWGLHQHYQTSLAVNGLVLGFSRTAPRFDESLAHLATILGLTHR